MSRKETREVSKKTHEKGSLSIHTENIFPIIKKWLYSDHDIFLRELVANATDAINKRRIVQPDADSESFKVTVEFDAKAHTLAVSDTGVGMTAEEIRTNINQIAFSGAEAFLEKYKDANIIGHFGLGFYSAFMVAEKVTIDTLSWEEGAEPAFWSCDGDTEYEMEKGKRTDVGTTITIHLRNEYEDYADEHKLKGILTKHCTFMPWPIELDGKVANLREALWQRKPADTTDEDYKKFYKELFNDWEEPLFWIHLNVDYPFSLKGLLYFPKLKNDFDLHRGEVKLYCRNVFVADNLKEFIPEFLLLLRGGIDIPDIPLNVSRSFLQQDREVAKISKYIVKKVADRFHELWKEDRAGYEKLWADIQLFVKSGLISDTDFYDAVKDLIIFKSSKGGYVTIEEYLERNPGTEKKVYYAPDEHSQSSALKLLTDQGVEVIFGETLLDTHLFQTLEFRMTDTKFLRIDSELNDLLVDNDRQEIVDADNRTEADRVKTVFDRALGDAAVTVEPKRLKTAELPAMVVFNEQMRRFQEMNAMFRGGEMNLLSNHTLVVNLEHPGVKSVLSMDALGRSEEADTLCRYLHQLALIEQQRFDGAELRKFVETAGQVLKMIK
jgi:molecular chaperone HtpG